MMADVPTRLSWGVLMTAFKIARGFSLAVLLTILAGTVEAASITINASQGNLAASATFEASGGNLKVTLTNTSLFDVLVPSDVLTALFFTIKGPSVPVLTPSSAILGIGSTTLFGSSDPGSVVGGEWAFGAGLAGAPHNASHGISSSGFDLFGAANFPGTNLQGPAAVDGIQFGITSAGDNPATGNTPVTGSNALIQNQVVFVLSGLPTGFDPASQIGNVSFQYGTSLSDTNIPEPLTAGFAAAGALFFRRRRVGGMII